MQNGERCGNCKFYGIDPQNVRQGFCRLKPPAIFPVQAAGHGGMQVQLQFLSQYPPVQEGQWCGEWKLKLSVAQ